jgi:putative transposase
VLIVSPDTVLRWHRELVRRKRTFRRKAAGRPKIASELEALVFQLARENARWSYDHIEGDLVKLGYTIDRWTIRNLLKCHRLPPSPLRQPKST